MNYKKIETRKKRQMHIRKTVSGTPEKPRITVFRSNAHIYAQIIDDVNMKTLVSASDRDVKEKLKGTDMAEKVGNVLAEKAKKAKIDTAVFDRRGYKYHGKIQALADGARSGGLKF